MRSFNKLIDFNLVDPASVVPGGINISAPAAAYAEWDVSTVNSGSIQATVENDDLSQAFGAGHPQKPPVQDLGKRQEDI